MKLCLIVPSSRNRLFCGPDARSHIAPVGSQAAATGPDVEACLVSEMAKLAVGRFDGAERLEIELTAARQVRQAEVRIEGENQT